MDRTPRQELPTLSRIAEIALIFCVFFVQGGAPAPHANETHYLVKARHYWNPDYCAGNLLLESTDAHKVFYWTVGWLPWCFSLPRAAWIGRCIVWTMLAVAGNA